MVPLYTDRKNSEGEAWSHKTRAQGGKMRKGSIKGAMMSCFESAPSVCCSCVIPYHFQPASCGVITGIELWRERRSAVHSGIFAPVPPAYLKWGALLLLCLSEVLVLLSNTCMRTRREIPAERWSKGLFGLTVWGCLSSVGVGHGEMTVGRAWGSRRAGKQIILLLVCSSSSLLYLGWDPSPWNVLLGWFSCQFI